MAVDAIWDDKYTVGVAEIDAQHKALFELYNGVLAAHEAGDLTIVRHVFEEMVNYMDKHFSTEEKFWRLDEKIYRNHRKLHFDFVRYVLRETAGGDNFDSLGTLLDFLSAWLLDHVQTVDKLEFQQLRDQGLL